MQYEQVKELIELFEKTDLNDMEVHLGDAAIRLNRGPVQPPQYPMMVPGAMPFVPPNMNPVTETGGAAVTASASPQTEGKAAKESVITGADDAASAADGTKTVKAPIVGTFYQSSAPDQPPFVKVGDSIAAGDVVCIIEAMKFMNEVTSDVSGKVVEILAEDGQFVEFGQELFRIQ